MEFHVKSISEAFPKLLKEIYINGNIVIIDERSVLEYPEIITTFISNPTISMMPDGFPWKAEILDLKYVPEILTGEDFGFTYTYGQRLNISFGVNQIQNIIKELKVNKTSRRCVAVTWRPCEDIHSDEPPCLDLIDFKLREGVLSLVTYLRSNDVFGAWPANAFVLTRLLESVAKELNAVIGTLTIVSNKAHIYSWNWDEVVKITGVTKRLELY